MAAALKSDRRLFLTASRDEVVEAGDPRAAILFAGAGRSISARDAERLGLSIRAGRIVLPSELEPAEEPGAKAAEPPEDKAQPQPENKARAARPKQRRKRKS